MDEIKLNCGILRIKPLREGLQFYWYDKFDSPDIDGYDWTEIINNKICMQYSVQENIQNIIQALKENCKVETSEIGYLEDELRYSIEPISKQ